MRNKRRSRSINIDLRPYIHLVHNSPCAYQDGNKRLMTVKMEVDLSLDHQIKIKRLPIGVHKINSLFLETLIQDICQMCTSTYSIWKHHITNRV